MNTADLPTEKDKKLSDFVTDQLYQALKPLGFKRRDKHNLYRELDESIQVINVQTAQHEKNRVGVNMGVYYPEVMKLLKREAPSRIPHESYCTLRSRLGPWIDPPFDISWVYVNKDQLEEYEKKWGLYKKILYIYTNQDDLADNITTNLLQKGIKIFEKFQTLNDFKTHLANTRKDEQNRYYALTEDDIQKILQQK